MNKRRFLLIYASQTGQAQAIAEELQEKAELVGLQADLQCISTTEKKFWLERETLAVIISSTTGDGDPPDTAQKFVRRLKKRTLPKTHLAQLKYAFLGLGDSNYTNFCNCGKMLDKRLSELGAQQIIPASWADDATGLELVVEPWIDSVIPALLKELGALEGSQSDLDNKLADSVASCDLTDLINQSEVSKVVTIEVSGKESEDDDNRNQKLESTLTDKGGDTDKQALIKNITSDSTSDSAKDVVNKEKSDSACDDNTPKNESVPVIGQSESDISKKMDKQGVNALVVSDITSVTTASSVGKIKDGHAINGGNVLEKKAMTGSQSTEINTTQPGSLTKSVPPLSGASLSVPLCPPSFIGITYHPDQSLDLRATQRNDAPFPSAKSPVTEVPILSAERITSSDAVKTALKLELGIQETGWDYQPGDSVGIVCENTDQEVECLLQRLSATTVADTLCSLSILSDTKKKNAKLPAHYPQSPVTLRHLLKYHCDIRTPPKKALLRAFVECCDDPAERRRLQELCSKQGSAVYSQYIREEDVSVLDVLQAFSSVRASLGTVLEHCPRLLPRPYSAASSPLQTPGRLAIVFNIVEIPRGAGRATHRRGLCTGMMSGLCEGATGQAVSLQESGGSDDQAENPTGDSCPELCRRMDRVDVQGSYPKVSVYLRTNQHFRPPEDLSIPCILIGPGTGVAPFIGFLQHRQAQLEQTGSENKAGEMWLFFGCRHKERDFLFRDELEGFVKSGILTNLQVSFSRDNPAAPNQPRYVQDKMKLQGEHIAKLICQSEARVYVCGDARGMARGVNQAFIEILQQCKGMSEKESSGFIMDMRINKRYLEDVWT